MEDAPSSSSSSQFKAPALPPNGIGAFKAPALSSSDGEVADKKAEPEPEQGKENKDVVPKKTVPAPPLDYTPPPWASSPDDNAGYKLEVVKAGSIVDCLDLSQRKNATFILVGRLPNCDIVLEHPSISRYHCIIQYGEDTMDRKGKGWHMYELGSTHGSKANKQQVPARQYVRIRVGYVLQFGASTRVLSLVGPAEDAEEEWDCSPTEMKEKIHRKRLEKKLAAQAKEEFVKQQKEDEEARGIDWGMDYEADDRPLINVDIDAHLIEGNDAYYKDDPRKALAKFFDREGFEPEFSYSESGRGHTHKWICAIELPIDTGGRTVTASGTVTTSKRDAQIQCALDACKILDAHGVLRGGRQVVKQRRKKLADDDYFNEDDDLYLDRTGQLEAQRQKRKDRHELATGARLPEKDTYDTLLVKLADAQRARDEVQKQLDAMDNKVVDKAGEAGDELDAYCTQLAKGAAADEGQKTKTEKSILRQKLVGHVHDVQRLEKLVKIAKPVALPSLAPPSASSSSSAGGADREAFMRRLMNMKNKKKADKAPERCEPVGMQLPPVKHMEEKKVEREEEEEEMVQQEKIDATPEAHVAASSEEKKDEVAAMEMETAEPPKKVQLTLGRKRPVEVEEEKGEEEVQSKKTLAEKVAEIDREMEETKKEVEAEMKAVEEKREEEERKKRRTRVRKQDRVVRQQDTAAEYGAGDEERDMKYATWLPPENQSGDGKTKLHDKFAGRY